MENITTKITVVANFCMLFIFSFLQRKKEKKLLKIIKRARGRIQISSTFAVNIKAFPLGQIMKQKCKFGPQSVAVHELIKRTAGPSRIQSACDISVADCEKRKIGHTHPQLTD